MPARDERYAALRELLVRAFLEDDTATFKACTEQLRLMLVEDGVDELSKKKITSRNISDARRRKSNARD